MVPPEGNSGAAQGHQHQAVVGLAGHGALIVVLSIWILHSFLEALLAACVTAIASWPLYSRFSARMPGAWDERHALIFTLLVTVLVLAPMMFALGALLNEANALLEQIVAADKTGIATPAWLENLPIVGRWLAARWEIHLARPGFFVTWTQGTDADALLGWAGSLGQFMLDMRSSSASRSSCCSSCTSKANGWYEDSGEFFAPASATAPMVTSISQRARCALR